MDQVGSETFMASSRRNQYIRHVLQNDKLLRIAMGFNDHNRSHKILNQRALRCFEKYSFYSFRYIFLKLLLKMETKSGN